VQLILMRHGEPERNPTDPRDPGLCERGWDHARAAIEPLRDRGVEAVYSSPQKRARQTATIVAQSLLLPIAEDSGLVEFDHGGDYVHYDDPSHPVWQSYFAGDLSPWGLTTESFHARIRATMQRIAQRHAGAGGPVLAVCHGGVINAWTCQVLGVADRIRVLEPGYGSLHRYTVECGRWRVLSLNETPASMSLSTGK
jgi:broad specificity phosphatase PhoE